MSPVPFYKCLSDETRLRCLLLLQQLGELCVCELMVALEETQPKISRHLAQLRKAELLIDRRQGQWVFYQINPALPDWAQTVLVSTASANQAFLTHNLERLVAMRDRPERSADVCGA